ncbi:MAG: GDP-mannose 4,6-dehydratase [Patescibacteria group bacterium]
MTQKIIFDKKNILIVGGAGFIGSHLGDELVVKNKVICLDNFLTGTEHNIAHLLQNPNFKFINHNIVEAINLEKQPDLKEFRIEFQGLQEIYFLASPTSPRDYSRYPIETLLANSVGLRNALDLAVKYKSQFLYVSGSAVYGQVEDKKKVKEDYVGRVDQLGPRACYEEAKRFGESLVNNYRLKYNIDAKIVRVFNCYGPRMRLGDGRMIPEIIELALKNKEIVIYGEKKSAGSYFYISDLIKALIKMMSSGEIGPLNLASEWQNSFEEVAQKIIQLTGSQAKVKYESTGGLMAPQLLGDITQAKERLGWFPIVLLDEGLKKTIDYLSAQQGILDLN